MKSYGNVFVQYLHNHTRTIYDISWCPVTDLIATACGDDMIRIFKESTEGSTKNEPIFEQILAKHRAHAQDVNTVKWNPTEAGYLLSTSDDGEAKIWKFLDD